MQNLDHCTSKLKRKRPKKVKPGMFPGSKPGQRLVLNKKVEISKNDPEDKVADELIYRSAPKFLIFLCHKYLPTIQQFFFKYGSKTCYHLCKVYIVAVSSYYFTLRYHQKTKTFSRQYLFRLRNEACFSP